MARHGCIEIDFATDTSRHDGHAASMPRHGCIEIDFRHCLHRTAQLLLTLRLSLAMACLHRVDQISRVDGCGEKHGHSHGECTDMGRSRNVNKTPHKLEDGACANAGSAQRASAFKSLGSAQRLTFAFPCKIDVEAFVENPRPLWAEPFAASAHATVHLIVQDEHHVVRQKYAPRSFRRRASTGRRA
jgi:hypothetical protein